MADRAVWQRTIVDERGNIIPGAEVTVRSYPGGSLVTLYEDPDGALKSNPFVTGNDGFARFWANSQRVEIVAVGAGSSIRWVVDLINADEVIGGAVSEATAAAAVAVSEAEAAADRAEAARDAAQFSAGIYEDTAAGLAATSDGDYFSVPAGDYLILYQNSSGAAVEISRTPSTTEVKNAIQRVDDLAGSEELQSIRATIESTDYSVAFADEAGNVAGGFDAQGRFVARIGQQVEQFEVETGGQYVWGIADEAGHVALGVDRAGNAAASGLNLPGYDIRSLSSPGISFAIADDQGRAAFIVYDDGTTSAGSGGGDDPQPITHTVEWSFAEPIDDPSKELFVTWLTDSPDAKVLEYRPRGGQAWMAASSFRSRPFPELSDKWLHTVELRSLSPDAVYDFRIPGSEYTDAVKTCPALGGLKVTLASDWQNQNYSESSPLRTFGDLSTAQEPDLIIFDGDYNNSDGRFTQDWAEDYVSIFQVFHDHWRGADNVQVPWVHIIGNHEGRNAAGTSNAMSGGDGTPGMLVDICSWTYTELHESRFARSVGTVRIRNQAAFVCLETDHTVPLMNQFDWYKEQLDTHCPKVSHSFVVGHVAPFNTYATHYTHAPARNLRNHFWTYAEQYSGSNGSLRAFLSGHAHMMIATPKLKIAYDDQEPDSVNDSNFYRDPDGIYNIGHGMVGGSHQVPQQMELVSNIDGQPWWDACIGKDPDANDYISYGAVQNAKYPVFNIWVLTMDKSGWSAQCINDDGDLFYEINEAGV